jgi:hypothetical protein
MVPIEHVAFKKNTFGTAPKAAGGGWATGLWFSSAFFPPKDQRIAVGSIFLLV